MNKCLKCEIHAKLICCCGCHPETKEQNKLKLQTGERVNACPNLNSEGLCKIYKSKNIPTLCKEFNECSYPTKQQSQAS